MELNDATESRCPVICGETSLVSLAADQELVFPEHKRVFHQYVTGSSGLTELRLWYGDKELSFDDPELFAFGENLFKQRSFVAGNATLWSEGYTWPRIRELLEQLIAEGVLFHANAVESVDDSSPIGSFSSTLPAAESQAPRTWFECESITRELTGQPIESGYLELVIPIFRVAHIAMDAEGRQVGEANVFPKPLRVDVPTDWRTCLHAGSRYQSDKPMNVSAMKAMRKHWPQMMAVLLKIREAYLQRFPEARGKWTIGDLERLSSLVLALPAYILMRAERPVHNGQLHPVFSSIFRVTDGLRLTLHQMLFLPTQEATLQPNAPITSPEIYAYAERNNGFISEYGVCAGPRAMIEEFLRVLVDGHALEDAESVRLDRDVETALDELQNAFDYGLYGLQVYAEVFSVWPAMARAYERLWTVLEDWCGYQSEPFRAFRNRFEHDLDFLRTRSLLATEEWRSGRDLAYADMYESCARGLGSRSNSEKLADRIAPLEETDHTKEAEQLRAIAGQRLFGRAALDSPDLDSFISALMDYLCLEQAIVRAACSTQQSINQLLGRTPPKRPFEASAIDLFNQLQGNVERLPYLVHELEEAFAMNIVVTHNSIEFSERMIA